MRFMRGDGIREGIWRRELFELNFSFSRRRFDCFKLWFFRRFFFDEWSTLASVEEIVNDFVRYLDICIVCCGLCFNKLFDVHAFQRCLETDISWSFCYILGKTYLRAKMSWFLYGMDLYQGCWRFGKFRSTEIFWTLNWCKHLAFVWKENLDLM